MQEEQNKELEYLAKIRPKKRIRKIYDTEVRKYLDEQGALNEVLAGDYTRILRPFKFEDMKQVDYEIYQQKRDDNIELRIQNGLDNTEEDTDIFYLKWLKNQVEKIDADLSATYPNGKKKPQTGSRQIQHIEQTKYRNYLQNEVKTVEEKIKHLSNKTVPLTHAQICLIRIYEQKPVSRTNAQNVAIEYGHTTPNSGKVLLKTYNDLDNENNRLRRRDLEKDLESIKAKLSGEPLQRAERELNMVRNKRR